MTLYYEDDPADQTTVPQLPPLLRAVEVPDGQDVLAKAVAVAGDDCQIILINCGTLVVSVAPLCQTLSKGCAQDGPPTGLACSGSRVIALAVKALVPKAKSMPHLV